MGKMPLPALPDNPTDLRAAAAFWQQLCTALLPSAWTTWLTPEPDGNPIYSARDARLGRAVRIIQEDPSVPSPHEWSAWIDTFAAGEPAETEELVFTCRLNEATAAILARLLSRWAEAATTRDQMERVIEEI